ncbi:polyketide synthase dehydratase domain-containing protein [Motilimonas sp. E26]|uniref:polyketide synthase dehydratase domain-containing protein n=1 Tax=Motilimonas sp. E26 TaxID=2865674 RepID=UPI001E354B40|nr:polyketide synthase dehydratase domain-containing protein [Motilimonas sp. E26]MCE0556905.1 polyketide synthase dehydratase domain-containing protein [Motilimonas sp. E26]
MLSIKNKQRLNRWLDGAKQGLNQQSRGIKYKWPNTPGQPSQETISQVSLPLLEGAVVHWDKHGLCQFHCRINEQHSPYLRHHRFPMGDIMPATAVLEYFVEAASWLQQKSHGHQQWYPLQVSQLKLDRVLILPQGSSAVDLQIHVNKRFIGPHGHEIQLSLHSPRFNKQGKYLGLKCHAYVTIGFDPSVRAINKVPLLNGLVHHYQTTEQQIYTKVLTSHGEKMQSITGELYINEERNQILASYDCQNKETTWLNSGNGHFVLSPLGLDSCLQLLCFLAILQDGLPRLPVFIGQLNLYRAHPMDQPCRALIELVQQDVGKTEAKVTVFDQHNRIVFDVKQAIAQSHQGGAFDLSLFERWLENILVAAHVEETSTTGEQQ